jgi:SAM-dependent methyltransferase
MKYSQSNGTMTAAKSIDVTEIMRDIRERVRQKQPAAITPDIPGPMLPASSMLNEARASLSELQKSAEHIDHLPPQPPTLRGAVGAKLSRFLRRLLFWQYAQARSFQTSVIRAIEQLLLSSDAVSSRNDQIEATLRRAAAKIQRLTERSERSEAATSAASETVQHLIERTGKLEGAASATFETIQRLTEHTERLSERLSKDNQRLQADLSSAHQKITELSNVIQGIVEQVDSAGQNTHILRQELERLTDLWSQESTKLAERVAAIDRYAIQTRRNVVLQEQRITSILSSVRKRSGPSQPDGPPETGNAASAPESMAGLYLALEDAFRGSPDDIAGRVGVYLPLLEQAGLKRGADLVIDIGCGRGEWLGLLSQNGYCNKGCDSNEAMVGTCRERGLDVVQQDALQFLNLLQADSVAAITAFHVIEHLPLAAMLALIDGSLRALRPGGVLIFETPNPQNILVASHNFYIDPTHHKPVPMQLLQFLIEARGFCDVQPIALHPYPESMLLDTSSEVARRFNEYFYGPQDYAILAKKP